METKRIAVLSGGGAMGLIQVSCMAELQKAGKKDFKAYDLYIGSSVGSINGALLALDIMGPEKMLEIYPEMLDSIFKKKLLRLVPKYDRANFIACWSKYVSLNYRFKDCKKDLVVSSVDVCSDVTSFFKSYADKDKDDLVVNYLLKSFAAPYFFGPFNDTINKKIWYDGGMGGCNIPIDYGYTEAVIHNWIGNYNVQIDAYGTSFYNTNIPYEKASKENVFKQFLNWMNPPEGGMARLQSRVDQVRKMTKIAQCSSNVHFDYYDIEIPEERFGIDKVNYKKEYIEYGKKMAENPLVSI